MREGMRACELVPIEQDSINGVAFVINLAQILAWVGEKEAAIDRILQAERVPNYLGYGLLKLDPVWDPLRGEARFEKIVASLAPKDGPPNAP